MFPPKKPFARSGERRRPHPRVARAALTTALSIGGVVAVVPSADAAQPADLTATKVTIEKTVVPQGGRFVVKHTVANRGRTKAGASETRFYLAPDAQASLAARRASRSNPRATSQDILLGGVRKVATLKPRTSATQRPTTVTVPVSTPPGLYAVLACTDDRGTVKERNEGDNCAVASKKLRVTSLPDSDILRFESFSEVYTWPTDESSSLSVIKAFCSVTRPARTMTLAGALTSARAHLIGQVGAGPLAQLDASPLARTAELSQELAGVAATQGNIGLTLAALLRAHRLEPRNAGHLLNAAAVATNAGLPNEALAMVDAAFAGRDLRLAPMGVSQQAIAQITRGNALLLTGRTAEATSSFLAAKRLEPLLSEADAGLATVEACAGRDDNAQRYLRKARQRHEELDTTRPDEGPVRPAPSLDTSLGQVTPLRVLPIAETPASGVEMYPEYNAMVEQILGEIDAHNAEDDALSQQIRADDESRTRAEYKRLQGLLSAVYNGHKRGDIVTARQAFYDASDELQEIVGEFFGEGTGETPYRYGVLLDAAIEACVQRPPGCVRTEMHQTCRPELTAYHARWRVALGEYQRAGDAVMALESQQISGIAANIADPAAHRLALLQIEELESSYFASLVHAGQTWTVHERRVQDDCVNPVPPQVEEAPTAPAAAATGPCTDQVKSFDLVVPLGPITVKANCEKIQVAVSTEALPLLHAFAEATWDPRAGKITFFAGAQASGRPLGLGELAFKSGIYATTDYEGLTDIGWRVGPSAAVGAGSFESGVANGEMDLSFVAGLRDAP